MFFCQNTSFCLRSFLGLFFKMEGRKCKWKTKKQQKQEEEEINTEEPEKGKTHI